MEFISKGGYAEIYYDKAKDEIYRRTHKFTPSTKQLDPSGINDLIFTKSFEYTNYTPVIHTETICEKYISFRMPHYGEPLHIWLHNNSIEIRQKYAAYILLHIVTACMHFDANAYFHSDLKPSNIMINTIYNTDTYDVNIDYNQKLNQDHDSDSVNTDMNDNLNDHDIEKNNKSIQQTTNEKGIKSLEIKIIDFNSGAVKKLDDNDEGIYWTNAIGTWNYCAPEIIWHEIPSKTSISWTIGLLATALIDVYGFTGIIPKDMEHKLIDQSIWSEHFSVWTEKYHDHPPLPRVDWYDPKWKKLIWNCTHWSRSKRFKLDEIYTYIYTELLDNEFKQNKPRFGHIYTPYDILKYIYPNKYHIHIHPTPMNERNKIIDKILLYCKKINAMYIFSTAISIFDRCGSYVVQSTLLNNINEIAAASVVYSCFLHNIAIFNSKRYIYQLLHCFTMIHKATLLSYVHTLGKYFSWKLWEKPAHIYIHELYPNLEYHPKLWEYMKEVFSSQKESYTQENIAKNVIEKLLHFDKNKEIGKRETVEKETQTEIEIAV